MPTHDDRITELPGQRPGPPRLPDFELYVGIDYSGAETPTSRLKALQVYVARPGELPRKQVSAAASPTGQRWNWSRAEVAAWLIELARSGVRYIAGIDHGFSFPLSYFERYRLTSWTHFLEDFVAHWPTADDHMYVDFIRDRVLGHKGGTLERRGGFDRRPPPLARTGLPTEFRLCEQWTSSCRSVFHFDVQGQVAKSTHAGIPWLKRIRDADERVHVWPFDGWQIPAGKCVLAEVYPSIFRNRYPRESRSADEQDAYAVARWLGEADTRGALGRYFEPPLTLPERRMADREGWILGVA